MRSNRVNKHFLASLIALTMLVSGCIKVGPDFKKRATRRSGGCHNRAGHDPLASGRLLDRSGRDHHGGTHLRNRPHHGTSAGALLDPLPDSVAKPGRRKLV